MKATRLESFHLNQTKIMSKLKEKKEARAKKLERIDALAKITKDEKRDWTPEETTEFEELEEEVRTLNEEIKTLEAQERAALIAAARLAGNPVQGPNSEKEERELDQYSLRKVMLAKLENRGLDGLEAELHQEGVKERQVAGAGAEGGYIIPEMMLGRLAQKYSGRSVNATGGTGGDQGGVNVPTDVMGYVTALRERSLMLQLGAQYLTGLVGNFDMPRENAVFTPGWKAENATADESSPTYTKASFSPKRNTGWMKISLQFLRQTSPATEKYLFDQIMAGNAEAIDFAGFAGPGTNSPTGILNDSDVAVTPIGTNGGAITQSFLDAMDTALRGRKNYRPTNIVTTAKVRAVLRNLKIDAGSGLFVWDRKDDRIDGKPAFDTTHLPDNLTKGTSTGVCSALIEGSFSDAMYGQWGGTEILNDPFTAAKDGFVTMVSHQYVDFHVIRPAGFQIIKDITTA